MNTNTSIKIIIEKNRRRKQNIVLIVDLNLLIVDSYSMKKERSFLLLLLLFIFVLIVARNMAGARGGPRGSVAKNEPGRGRTKTLPIKRKKGNNATDTATVALENVATTAAATETASETTIETNAPAQSDKNQ